ncbi:sulfotransferase [Thermococcus sp. GR6]|uniref:sulfotransferase family protein n=1 Tax=Thermococcus sp. GR6 TaxID=1638256 RepID=UPI00142F52D6|nr:sulfotransferase [Thermococcus sp. GR6]NJE42903.1 sulfotransferase [Thermococcus sp. GR6]
MKPNKISLYKPVFIVSIYRTGSTLLRNILDKNPFIAMIPEEVHLWNPYLWRKDVVQLCKKSKLNSQKDIENLIEMLFSKKLYGPFWKRIDEYNIQKDQILNQVKILLERKVKLTCVDIVNLIFLEYLRQTDKIFLGAKNPVYASNIQLLEELYPGCKIIYLIRDPRAIYLSKTNDEFSRNLKRKINSKSLSNLFDFLTLTRVILEYTLLFKTYKKNKNKRNLYLVRYEDIVTSPKDTIKRICVFLNVPFKVSMLYVTGKPSSINQRASRRSIDPKSAYLWKKRIHPWENLLLTRILYKSMKEFGYIKESDRA